MLASHSLFGTWVGWHAIVPRNDISSELSPAIQQALDKISKANEASNVSISEMLRQSEPDSLVAVQTFETAQAISNQHEYQQHVVAYAETWEVVVTNTVEVLTKTVRKLQGDRDHYEKKYLDFVSNSTPWKPKVDQVRPVPSCG